MCDGGASKVTLSKRMDYISLMMCNGYENYFRLDNTHNFVCVSQKFKQHFSVMLYKAYKIYCINI